MLRRQSVFRLSELPSLVAENRGRGISPTWASKNRSNQAWPCESPVMKTPWENDAAFVTQRKLAKLDEHRRRLLKNAFGSVWQGTRGLNILDIASPAERAVLEEGQNRRVIIRRDPLTDNARHAYPDTRLTARQAFVQKKFSDFPDKVDGVVCQLWKRAQETLLVDCPVAIREDLQFVLQNEGSVHDEINAAFEQLADSIKGEYEVEAGLARFAPIDVGKAWELCKAKLLALLDELERSLLNCGAAEGSATRKPRRGRKPSLKIIRRNLIIYQLHLKESCSRRTLLNRAKASEEIKSLVLEDGLNMNTVASAMKMGRDEKWTKETTFADVMRDKQINLT